MHEFVTSFDNCTEIFYLIRIEVEKQGNCSFNNTRPTKLELDFFKFEIIAVSQSLQNQNSLVYFFTNQNGFILFFTLQFSLGKNKGANQVLFNLK